MTKEIVFTINPERIRQIGSRGNIEHMTTANAEAFMTLYAEKMEAALVAALRTFIDEKLK